MTTIRRVAVLGAGVMGSGIAAHLANAGIESLLFDIVPRDAGDDPKARSAFAVKGLQAAVKSRPPAFFTPAGAKLVTPCNYDDHADLLATCDWIVEVVVERLDIKKKVFSWVAENRREGSIVSSNTSGIELGDMVEDMSDEMRRHFLITHFFNPVRYMKLLEIVPGPETDPAVTSAIAAFGAECLGKGIVYGKDTPNFIANRIGTYGMAVVFPHMAEAGLSVKAVDTIMGPAMGRPKSAVFRTADIVGLDTLAHVFGNVYDGAPDDEGRMAFVVPDVVQQLVADGRTGQKAGAGFYKKVKVKGRSQILELDLSTLEYIPSEKHRYASTGKARKLEDSGRKIAAVIGTDDVAGNFAWTVTADTLIYAANRVPEIADDIVNVDNAMRWGFAHDLGPFETWDAIGVASSVERMEGEGRTVPAWVKGMLATGRETFYQRDDEGALTYWSRDGASTRVPRSPRHIRIDDLKARGAEIERNTSASLLDLGDGVLGLEFHSKMNAIDGDIMSQYNAALDRLDAGEFQALVVGNQDPKAFCAGANLMMVLMAIGQGAWDQLEDQIATLQRTMQRAKYSKAPVVTAPHGLTLGGGAEVAMHSAATVAAGDLFMGLVEVGVGVIPAGGGCTELLSRYLGNVPQDVNYDPNPYIQAIFQRIGLAKVGSSAEEARAWGYLRPSDRVVLDADALLFEAKRTALGLVAGGWQPPRAPTFKLPGASGRAAIELFLYQMKEGGQATPHDATVGQKLAYILTGGDIPAGTVCDEQHVLDLEREAFLSLCGDPNTQARITHMLQKGKPLRN
jgi:3-hydroxyacyl-CoA dehydrogenase